MCAGAVVAHVCFSMSSSRSVVAVPLSLCGLLQENRLKMRAWQSRMHERERLRASRFHSRHRVPSEVNLLARPHHLGPSQVHVRRRRLVLAAVPRDEDALAGRH